MLSYQNYSDEQLAELLKGGDEEAFAQLFERHKSKVYAYAYKWTKSKAEAEEITQDIFVNLWINRNKLPDILNVSAYIYKIAVNKTYDYLRSDKAKEFMMKQFAALCPQKSSAESAEYDYLLKENEGIVSRAISQLSQQKQRIFYLSTQEAKTPKEIAKDLNLTSSTVRSHLSDAIQHIRTSLKGVSFVIFFVFVNYFK